MQDDDNDIQAFIRSIPNVTQLSLRAHILLVGYYLFNSGFSEFSLLNLKNNFIKARLPYIPSKVKNALRELSAGDKSQLIIKGNNRYVISIYGDEEIKIYLKNKPHIETGITSLKDMLPKIRDNNQKLFLGESISCAENRSYRAAIIMTWVFVINHLQEYVINSNLSDFNNALLNRSEKLKNISKKDDFEILKESVLIEILRSANIISKGAKKILDSKLDIRNSCAHPSDIVIKESTVVEFIDSLIENIILKYRFA